MYKLLFFKFRVTNLKLKNLLRVTNPKNEKIKSCFESCSRLFYRDETLYDLELIEKKCRHVKFCDVR